MHCAAAPARQAAWDLVTRDLTAAPFNMSSETAFITGNRLFYLGSGNIGLWYSCTCGGSSDGCGATSGYMQWLAADDDNGNLNNGTPHMTAIYAAYNRHGIACATPTPVNSGCAGGPTGAPTVTARRPGNRVTLNWTAVAGRDGLLGVPDGGPRRLQLRQDEDRRRDRPELPRTTTVAHGRDYYYNVVAHGSSQSCFGPASACVTVTPGSSPLEASREE